MWNVEWKSSVQYSVVSKNDTDSDTDRDIE